MQWQPATVLGLRPTSLPVGRAAPAPQGLVRALRPAPSQPAGVPALDTRWQRGLYQSLTSTGLVCSEPLPHPTFSFFSTQGLFTHQWARAHLRHLKVSPAAHKKEGHTHLQASTVTLSLQVNSGNLISPSESHQDCVY